MKSLVFFILGSIALTVHAERPNVIVFMADDMGYADAGFTGATDIKTPHLDALAASGVVFKQGYVTHPFCGPSRAGFMSGRYQERFGFDHNPAYDPANPLLGIDPEEVLFPKRLQDAGYYTGIIGKWHLGAAAPFNPLNRGFDYFYGFLGGGHDYFDIDMAKPVHTAYLQGLVRNKLPAGFEGYITTALSRDAVKFVEDNSDKPFFLFVAYNAPHGPLQAPQEDIDRYSHIEDRKRQIYAAMVDVMDRGIGEVVAALKEEGVYENTLIFFLSDNGGPQTVSWNPHNWNGSSNGPLRGGKTNLYDGGVHVPFIASWPKGIKPGQTFDFPVISLDIGRTAVELAGGDPEKGHVMEGVNLIPFLNGDRSDAPHDALYWKSYGNWSVLSSAGYKHLKDPSSRDIELFFLPDDIGEENDMLSNQAEVASQLRSKWEAWNAENVPGRLGGYMQYFIKRDDFFYDAIPQAAIDAGYDPEFPRMFKKK
ncbi:MAG: sulfatase-like hydrolase/transferase [Verrucomicrobiota bacterium]